MRIYRADSPEAIANVFDIAYKNWTLQKMYVRLHISANASGPLFVSNMNPSWKSEITLGNSSAYRRSVCEYIERNINNRNCFVLLMYCTDCFKVQATTLLTKTASLYFKLIFQIISYSTSFKNQTSYFLLFFKTLMTFIFNVAFTKKRMILNSSSLIF
jgi:hypothetical protein